MVKICNDTRNIFSDATENKFVSPAQVIMINKDHGRKKGLEITRVSWSD